MTVFGSCLNALHDMMAVNVVRFTAPAQCSSPWVWHPGLRLRVIAEHSPRADKRSTTQCRVFLKPIVYTRKVLEYCGVSGLAGMQPLLGQLLNYVHCDAFIASA